MVTVAETDRGEGLRASRPLPSKFLACSPAAMPCGPVLLPISGDQKTTLISQSSLKRTGESLQKGNQLVKSGKGVKGKQIVGGLSMLLSRSDSSSSAESDSSVSSAMFSQKGPQEVGMQRRVIALTDVNQ
jgi:hypothetical protein